MHLKSSSPSRRQFLQLTVAAAAATAIPGRTAVAGPLGPDAPFQISLAEWSLHRTLRDDSKDMTNLDFPRVAKEEFGIDAVEFVNQFFKDKAKDTDYLAELQQRCEDLGVKSLLIMVDGEGRLGDPNKKKRLEAVENHFKWVSAAKSLGCHSIRVNAASSGGFEEQQKLAADGLQRLSEYAAPYGINVIVENHGGLSSHGEWLAGVIEMVDLDNCGTLPDFGNFYITRGENAKLYNRYKGVDELMPYAKAVSAKTYDFGENGNETTIDYHRMMKIVLDHGYHGHVGIEYEGDRLGEFEGIKKSKALLERVAADLQKSGG